MKRDAPTLRLLPVPVNRRLVRGLPGTVVNLQPAAVFRLRPASRPVFSAGFAQSNVVN